MNKTENNPPILLIKGPRDSGKTSVCERIIKEFQKTRVKITGIISKGLYQEGKKIAIEAINLDDYSKKILACYSPGWDRLNPQREWEFLEEALVWGNEMLGRAVPTEILIIDELGYLELEMNRGWSSAFKALDSFKYRAAIVSIRPGLVSRFNYRYPFSTIFQISDQNSMNQVSCHIISALKEIFVN